MAWLLSVTYLGCLALLTPIYTTLMLISFPFPRFFRYRIACLWLKNAIWLGERMCGMRYQIIGRENIPAPTNPHLILSKHSSAWETFFLGYFFPPQAIIAKKELLWIPFFGWALAMCSPIVIDRSKGSNAFQKMAIQSRCRLKQGFWITIFPEGTRIPVGQRSKYKTGGARLALELDLPILPIAHNAGYLWPKKGLVKKPGLITISIGAPIAPQGHDIESLTKAVEDWIETEVARLGDGSKKSSPH